jgi:hypothetical protein
MVDVGSRREQLKAVLMQEMETIVEQLLDWNDEAASPTLTEIEEAILPLGREVQEKLAERVIGGQAQQRPIEVACPVCGETMRYKDTKAMQVQSSLGSLQLERGYYYCAACREGVFPPGPSTGSGGRLE